MASSCYVYYCSGHGFGHGTRVSAFASQLLSLPEGKKPVLHIVSSAPSHVFGGSIALGAQYRYADWIDPIIVQPLAYRVDRQKSVEVLKAFLNNKDNFMKTERDWLISVEARCVLSDAAFLGCLAAKAAGIPSILVTNFTFDSVYSYLATNYIDEQYSAHPNGTSLLSYDAPIPRSVLEPLVSQIHAGYRCADLLLLLPGHIPIPSFTNQPSLPATDWIDSRENGFSAKVVQYLSHLKEHSSECILLDHIPFPSSTALYRKSASATSVRKVLHMPLLVRPPSSLPEHSPYTPQGRARILDSADVPLERRDPETTKVLVVSFGGQVLNWPSQTHSSAAASIQNEDCATLTVPKIGLGIELKNPKRHPSYIAIPNSTPSLELQNHCDIDPLPIASPRLTTPSHIWIPGAPPVVNPRSPNISSPRTGGVTHTSPYFGRALEKENEFQDSTISPSYMGADTRSTFPALKDMINMPVSSRESCDGTRCEGIPDINPIDDRISSRPGKMHSEHDGFNETVDPPQLLPDSSWITIICGASDEQRSDISTLPENFYLAPKDVYMPDLTAIADVLLGKLGYGTVAECIDAGTPLVYVSRPLFVEELGLKVLIEKEGVGVEMSRAHYEDGRWAEKVKEAWEKAKVAKEWKRKVEGEATKKDECGGRISERESEIRRMAGVVLDWVEDWWQGI